MNVIKQSPDEFIVQLEVEPLHWWQKIYLKIYDWWINKHSWIAYRK